MVWLILDLSLKFNSNNHNSFYIVKFEIQELGKQLEVTVGDPGST